MTAADTKRMPRGRRMILTGDLLDRAVALYEGGERMEAVARVIGMPAPTVQNAVMAALCVRLGHRPAERNGLGYLTPASIDRLREMLRKGMKGVDIQLRLAVSASTISNERRRYNADLKSRGKRPLPPPGGGEAYSGKRLDRAQIKEVEAMLLTGLGSPKVAARLGLSSTTVIRLRAALVKRLARKGQALPGCDRNGRRHKLIEQLISVPPVARETLRGLLLDRVPVSRAAKIAVVGASTAYRIRDELRAELEARGKALPPPIKLGRVKAREADYRAGWLPSGRRNYLLYRQMLERAAGNEAEARRLTVRAIAERDGENPQLAEQFDRLRKGATISTKPVIRRADPEMTLGGIATAAL